MLVVLTFSTTLEQCFSDKSPAILLKGKVWFSSWDEVQEFLTRSQGARPCWFRNIKYRNHPVIEVHFGLAFWTLPGGSDCKESACNAGYWSSVPGLGRSPGEGNGYPLQYICLENSMDRRAWRVTVHGVTKSRTQMSTHAYACPCLNPRTCDCDFIWKKGLGRYN